MDFLEQDMDLLERSIKLWYNNVINRIEDVRGHTGLGGSTRRLHHEYTADADEIRPDSLQEN